MSMRRKVLSVLAATMLAAPLPAVAQVTTEEILKEHAAVSQKEIDGLIGEIGHREFAHRKKALEQASHLTAPALEALVDKLKASHDPELMSAAESLASAQTAAGPTLPSATIDVMKKAVSGDARMQGTLAAMFADCDGGLTRNPAEALRWAQSVCARTNAFGQYALARLYEEGCGVGWDTNKAAELYIQCTDELRKMAQKGDAEAQSDVGWIYEKGRGVQTNREEAIKWYRKSADQGYARGQFLLLMTYTDDFGVPADNRIGAARELCLKAAEQGCAEAQNQWGVWCSSGSEGFPADDGDAIVWYRKAALVGLPCAEYNVGKCYADGHGVVQNQAEALKWYRKAAEDGDPVAQTDMAALYMYGEGPVKKDVATAVAWYLKACSRGSAEAFNNLAWVYATCRDAEYRDGKKAVECASQACSMVPTSFAFLDTLAAAYARDGQFDKAVEAQSRAVELANGVMTSAGYTESLADRLALYKKKEMYVDEDGDGL